METGEKKDIISVIVPCLNEEDALPLFYKEITKISECMEEVSFEFLFVDDGSTDNTLTILRSFAIQDGRVRYLSFSRNFGKEAAIFAGLKNCRGDYAVFMDADLQDPPGLLPEMFAAVKGGECDSVATRRVSRKGEPPVRSFFARLFYKIINRISDADIMDGARDYRLLNRKMIQAILDIEEYNRFSKGIFGWIGFRTKWIEFENVERVAGETKWSFFKLLRYSLDGITAFSVAPLQIASVLGVCLSGVSALAILVIVVRTLLFGDPVAGWPSMVCVITLLGGLQLLAVGILGQYLAKTYLETKRRPIYILREDNLEKAEKQERREYADEDDTGHKKAV